VELIGRTPTYTEKVFIDIPPVYKRTTLAHAHSTGFCYNRNHSQLKTSLGHISNGSWDMVAMHELAHVFSRGPAWEIEPESIVELFTSYALENIPEARYGSTSVQTTGTQHRLRKYQTALNSTKTTSAAFDANSKGAAAYDVYLLGLVDAVGWDAYRKAFRSYDDKNFKPNQYSNEGKGNVRNARDLFDRIEHFSGKPGVLRTLPDRGALLDKHFNVQVIEQNLKPRVNINEGIGR